MAGRLFGMRTGPPAVGFAAVLVALALCCSPCAALGYLYTDPMDQPVLVAYPRGDTSYYPGDTFAITVVLANAGRGTGAQAAPRLTRGAYDPSTALGVVVRPSAGSAPVTLKSLPVMAGDIGSWDEVPVTIRGTIRQDAASGIYQIPLDVTYSYVYAIPVVGPEYSTIEPVYYPKNQTLPVMFQVMGTVRPEVVNETPENLFPGTRGYLTIALKNTGYRDGTEVTLRLAPADNITFQMVDDSLYLPKYMPGDTVPLRTRIAVRDGTAAGMYPATVEGRYRDTNGTFRTITPIAVGIPVSRGPVLEVLAGNLTIGPGMRETITVSFVNTGDTPAYDAKARIIGSQVIVPVMDSADLGTVLPGEKRTASFILSAPTATAGKRYVIDAEVKYRDALGALVLSDPQQFGVDISRPSGLTALLSDPVLLVLSGGILAVFGSAGYWWIRMKRKRKD